MVNNAGILISADFASVSMEEVDQSMQVSKTLLSEFVLVFVIVFLFVFVFVFVFCELAIAIILVIR